jgi:hypothetical protein
MKLLEFVYFFMVDTTPPICFIIYYQNPFTNLQLDHIWCKRNKMVKESKTK